MTYQCLNNKEKITVSSPCDMVLTCFQDMWNRDQKYFMAEPMHARLLGVDDLAKASSSPCPIFHCSHDSSSSPFYSKTFLPQLIIVRPHHPSIGRLGPFIARRPSPSLVVNSHLKPLVASTRPHQHTTSMSLFTHVFIYNKRNVKHSDNKKIVLPKTVLSNSAMYQQILWFYSNFTETMYSIVAYCIP